MKNIKFEHVFGVLIYLGIMICIFKFADNADVIDKTMMILTNTMTAITTYVFTKHNPSKDI